MHLKYFRCKISSKYMYEPKVKFSCFIRCLQYPVSEHHPPSMLPRTSETISGSAECYAGLSVHLHTWIGEGGGGRKPGFCYTRRLKEPRRRALKTPVTEHHPPSMCVGIKHGLLIFVIDLFPVEERWCYCKMGRGRKGLIEQSKRKPKVRRSESERVRQRHISLCRTER